MVDHVLGHADTEQCGKQKDCLHRHPPGMIRYDAGFQMEFICLEMAGNAESGGV